MGYWKDLGLVGVELLFPTCNLQMTPSFFSRASPKELETLKIILEVFRHISGLKVNLEKSTLYGINVDLDQLNKMALVLDSKVLDWLVPYLGLLLGRTQRQAYSRIR